MKKIRELTFEELEELKVFQDKPSEIALVASFFKNEVSFLELEKFMNPQYDFFDRDIRDLYENYALCYKTFSTEIKAEVFIQFMQSTEDRKEFFENMGGWESIVDMMAICDEKSYENYFHRVKKFALLREYYIKGFPSKKIMNMKDFELLKPEDILTIMQTNLDKIYTDIGGGKEAILLGSNARSQLRAMRDKPDVGSPIADWKVMTAMTRGLRKKKVTFVGMVSNDGKSRNAVYLAVHNAILTKTPTLVIMNETDGKDAFLCAMTTILNSPAFGYNIGIKEETLAMGDYDSESQFNKVLEIAEWFEQNTNIHFIETTRYTDKDLSREIKKYSVGKGVELVIYDTMKASDNNWETLKSTATFLKDIATDLNIHVWATFQCSDDVVLIAPHEMTNMNIASAKQIRHLCDTMFMMRKVEDTYKMKYKYKQVSLDYGDASLPLKLDVEYYYNKCLKNRVGKKQDTLYNVNLDTNQWKELGLVYTG